MKNREILGVSGVIRVHSNSIVKFSELISVGEKKIGTSIADYSIEFMKPHSLIVKRNKLEISLKLLINFFNSKKNYTFQIIKLKDVLYTPLSSYHLDIKKISTAWRGYKTTAKLQQTVII